MCCPFTTHCRGEELRIREIKQRAQVCMSSKQHGQDLNPDVSAHSVLSAQPHSAHTHRPHTPSLEEPLPDTQSNLHPLPGPPGTTCPSQGWRLPTGALLLWSSPIASQTPFYMECLTALPHWLRSFIPSGLQSTELWR